MKEHPIIFTGESVRAILDGRKTQTRWIACSGRGELTSFNGKVAVFRDSIPDDPSPLSVRCRCRPRDKLWVKETWKTSEYECASEPQPYGHVCSDHCHQTYVYYHATPRIGYRPKPDKARIRYLSDDSPLEPKDWYEKGWRSPRYMPRWASRIDLEVLSVLIQRLQDISEEDAKAEGMLFHDGRGIGHSGWKHKLEHGYVYGTAREAYSVAWDAINGKRASWASNPPVRTIEFKRVRP